MKKLTILIVMALSPISALAADRKPNIIIFLADDLGYADLGCQGCQDIPTPHIDSIAKNGVRFTAGYATHPVCAPSRAGLMTGLYQHRFGFEHNPGPERYAAPNFGVPREIPTLAEKLKAAGYTTCLVGKWHIGFREGLRPWERGFDYFYGFLGGARSYYPDNPREIDPILRNGQPVTDEKEYLTDAFAREAVAFLDRSKDKPWFLYMAFNAVHSPMEAPEKYTLRFPNLTGTRRTYAGMLSAMDDAVGRVLAKVRELNQEENTLIFFYSDNGGPTPQTTSRNDPLRGYKGQVFEGGIRVPFLMQWKGVVPPGTVYEKPVMAFDIHVTALAAAKTTIPTDQPLDGVNLIPFVTGQQSGAPHEVLFWRGGLQHAVRMGDWKLVCDGRVGGRDMLFNLAEDVGEMKDLAREKPEVLKQLQAAYEQWDQRMMPAQWIRQDARNADIGGKRSSDVFPGAAPVRRIKELFQTADRNGDGKLSRDEFPRPAIFSAMDVNSDGFVTIDEIQRYYRAGRGATSRIP